MSSAWRVAAACDVKTGNRIQIGNSPKEIAHGAD
jgi:hypothetical protein